MGQAEFGDNQVTLAASVASDRDRFWRRDCPSCGRGFKTKAEAADLQWLLASQCRRLGFQLGDQADKTSPPVELACPYCGYSAAGADFHTRETVEYLKRLLYREYVLPLVNETFSGLADSIGGRQSSGFLSMSFQFKHSRPLLPPRPIHGPEVGDMKIVTFLCCGKELKVTENWWAIDKCSYCGAAVTLL
jgi:hypothetical protein